MSKQSYSRLLQGNGNWKDKMDEILREVKESFWIKKTEDVWNTGTKYQNLWKKSTIMGENTITSCFYVLQRNTIHFSYFRWCRLIRTKRFLVKFAFTCKSWFLHRCELFPVFCNFILKKICFCQKIQIFAQDILLTISCNYLYVKQIQYSWNKLSNIQNRLRTQNSQFSVVFL